MKLNNDCGFYTSLINDVVSFVSAKDFIYENH